MSKHDQIAESLTTDILRGQYRPGERLPSERDLAARFDANRGAVREAMKKLEHLGIASVQPGGARVVPLDQASLDIIEPLLALGDIPNRELVDSILQVIDGLVQVALESTFGKASEEQLEALRALVRPLYEDDLNKEAHLQARFNLMQSIMTGSNNLVCQLIARSLLMRFAPRMAPLHDHFAIDLEAYKIYARQLDAAIGARDLEAIRAVFGQFAQLNHESVNRAFASYEAAQNGARKEVAAS